MESALEEKKKTDRPCTGRGPKLRFKRHGEAEAHIIQFPDDVDGIELLERCFKKHGMTITPESAARCDAVLAERERDKKRADSAYLRAEEERKRRARMRSSKSRQRKS